MPVTMSTQTGFSNATPLSPMRAGVVVFPLSGWVEQSQKANTLWLTNAAAAREHLGKLARVTRVHIYLNRSSKPLEATLSPNELQPCKIPLGRIQRIKRIRIEVLGIAPGSNKEQRGGFAEVGLLLEKEKGR